jgi:hypothetical protein
MNCPDCGAAMDLRQAGTFNAHWECPFDQQVEWVEKWSDDGSGYGDPKAIDPHAAYLRGLPDPEPLPAWMT